jgi:methylenetetrahydrofolate--tRNA-(uracil-5-)-methyltransferase
MADAYSMVGFQNHLRFGEQERMIRLIPGLENAELMQFGQIHRNTFICGPRILSPTLQVRKQPSSFFAGQITGVEGYVESVGTGWLAGLNAARLATGRDLLIAPPKSAIGALARYVSGANPSNYQPVNITFALLEPLPPELRKKAKRKRERHELQVELALNEWDSWLETSGLATDTRDLVTAP